MGQLFLLIIKATSNYFTVIYFDTGGNDKDRLYFQLLKPGAKN